MCFSKHGNQQLRDRNLRIQPARQQKYSQKKTDTLFSGLLKFRVLYSQNLYITTYHAPRGNIYRTLYLYNRKNILEMSFVYM